MSYVYNRIKAFPSDFAVHNATPFLHRHLYKDNYVPPCIFACFSTSVMYTNRTESNKGMVFRALQQDVDKLVAGTGNEIVTTPYEKLARVHALFMYQIIRLFDGDVALRAQGERDMELLERWVGELSRVGDNLGSGSRSDQDESQADGVLSSGCELGTANTRSVKELRRMRELLSAPVSWEVSKSQVEPRAKETPRHFYHIAN